MTLALTHRPKRLETVVGQNHIKPVLRAIVMQKKVPPALVFAGPRGTGKTSMGRIFAAALNCDKAVDGDCCGECESCLSITEGNNLSVIEIDAASHGLVADIRRIQELVEYTHEENWRVVLLDEAHSMSREAHNALLKVLEEPPENTVFVLLTTAVNKLPETVRSRAMRFDFRPHTVDDTVAHLRKFTEMDDSLLYEIARRSGGGLRDAMMMLDQAERSDIRTLAQFEALSGFRDISVTLMVGMLAGDFAMVYEAADSYLDSGNAGFLIDDLTELIRELLVWSKDGTVKNISEAMEQERRPLVERVSVPMLVQCMRTLWQIQERMSLSEADRRSAVLIGLALLTGTLSSVSIPTMPVKEQAEVRLTPQQMREAAEDW